MKLAEQQQALLSCIFDVQPSEPNAVEPISADQLSYRGLQAYRANAHASAERSLAAAYPTVQRILGETAFASLARAHWHACPPVRGDLAQWGSQLPEWVELDEQLRHLPYLGDVARVEWGLHRIQFEADTAPAPESFALLSRDVEAASTHTLLMASGFQMISLASAAGSIVLAHQESSPDWQALRRRMDMPIAEQVLLWRHHWSPRLRVIGCQAEIDLLDALMRGHSLADALAAAVPEHGSEEPGSDWGFDFSQWLTAAVSDGLVVGLLPLSNLHQCPSQNHRWHK